MGFPLFVSPEVCSCLSNAPEAHRVSKTVSQAAASPSKAVFPNRLGQLAIQQGGKIL